MTPEERRAYLLKNGYDPDQYEVLTDEEYNERFPSQAQAQEVAEKPKIELGDALWTRAKRTLLPSGASLAGAAAGFKATTALTANPFIGLGGAVVGGILGGMGGAGIQEKVLQTVMDPEEYQKGREHHQRVYEERPVVATVGDVAGSLGFMSPSKEAFKAAVKLPQVIGGRGKASIPVKLSTPEKVALAQTGVEGTVGAGVDLGMQVGSDLYNNRPVDVDWLSVAGQGLGEALLPTPWNNPINRKIAPNFLQQVATPPVINPQLQALLNATPQAQAPAVAPAGVVDSPPAPAKKKGKGKGKPKAAKPAELAPAADLIPAYPDAPVSNIPDVDTPQPTPNEAPALSVPDLDAPVDTPVAPKRAKKTKAKKKDTLEHKGSPLEGPADPRLVSELSDLRGTKVVQDEKIVVDPKTGETAFGSAHVRTRESHFAPDARRDTPGHEIVGHQFVRDLLSSTDPKDNEAAKRALEEFNNDEEALADYVGKRIVEVGEKPFRSYFADLFTKSPAQRIARKGLYDRPFTDDTPMMEGFVKNVMGQKGDEKLHQMEDEFTDQQGPTPHRLPSKKPEPYKPKFDPYKEIRVARERQRIEADEFKPFAKEYEQDLIATAVTRSIPPNREVAERIKNSVIKHPLTRSRFDIPEGDIFDPVANWISFRDMPAKPVQMREGKLPIAPYWVDVKNPVYTRDMWSADTVAEDLYRHRIISPHEYERTIKAPKPQLVLREILRNKGYDGIATEDSQKGVQVIPFHRDQLIRVNNPERNDEGVLYQRKIKGSNTKRSRDLLANNMYNKAPANTATKELVQNAIDSYVGSASSTPKVVVVAFDELNKVLEVSDRGSGMTPELMLNKFLPAFESGKSASDSAGGFGLAKFALFGNKELSLESVYMENGRQHVLELKTTEEGWATFMDEGLEVDDVLIPGKKYENGAGLEFSFRPAKKNEFPAGLTGTYVKIQLKPDDEMWQAKSYVRKLQENANDANPIFPIVDKSSVSLRSENKDRPNTAERIARDYEIYYDFRKHDRWKVLKELDLPTAKVIIRLDEQAEPSSWNTPTVLNRGVYQFDWPQSFGDLRTHPAQIDIHSKVPVIDPNGKESKYPFTIDRGALKSEVLDAVKKEISAFAGTLRRKEVSNFKRAIDESFSKIPGRDYNFLDLSFKLKPEDRDALADLSIFRDIGDLINETFNEIKENLPKLGAGFFGTYLNNAEFSGFTNSNLHGRGHLGVRLGKGVAGSPGKIYFDLGATFEFVQELDVAEQYGQTADYRAGAVDRVPYVVPGVLIHELGHQINFSEGEGHARAMTFLGGALSKYVGKLTVKLEELIEANKDKYTEDFSLYAKTIEEASIAGEHHDLSDIHRKLEEGEEYSEVQLIRAPDSIRKQGPENRQGNQRTNEGSGDGQRSGEVVPGDGGDVLYQIKPLKSVVASLDDGTREGKLASRALRDFETDQTRYTGRFVNRALEAIRGIKSSEAKKQLMKYLWDVRHTGTSSVPYFNESKPEIKALRAVLREVHNEERKLGMKVKVSDKFFRDPKSDPKYSPDMLDPAVAKVFAEGGPEFAGYEKIFKDYLTKEIAADKKISLAKAAAQAEPMVDAYINSLRTESEGTSRFAALRKAEGYGLPFELIDKSAASVFTRYGSKVARDMAFFKNIESLPILRTIFGIQKPAWEKTPNPTKFATGEPIRAAGGSAGIAARNRITGNYAPESFKFRTLEKLVRSALLGPITAVKNHISAYVQVQPYVPLKYQGALIKAWGGLQKGLRDSMDMGVNRWDITNLEVDNLTPQKQIDKVAGFFRKIQGYQQIEQYTRAHNMMVGELVTYAMWGKATKGGEETKFFKKFGEGMALDFTKPPTEEQVREIAARFVETVQGTYNTKGIPHWLSEPTSWAYWLMSLSKWSVERANIIHDDVLVPATKGDVAPLIRYTIGAILGGALAREVTELMTGKKQEVPTLKEAAASKEGKVEGTLYEIINLMHQAGWAGIYLDMVKIAADIANKNHPRVPSIPSVEFLTETIIQNTGHAAQAINEGEDPLETTLSLIKKILTDTVQGVRVINTRFVEPEDTRRKNLHRDLRTYNRLEDKPMGNTGVVTSNPFLDVKEKEFKRTSDPREARDIFRNELLPAYRELPPSERRKKLEALKRNSYQIMPNDPHDLKDYMDYLDRVSPGEGRKRLEEKRKQDAANRLKSSMIP